MISLFSRISLFMIILIVSCSFSVFGQNKYNVLIIDGQNDHLNWKKSTQMMKIYLEETGLFSVELIRNYPSEGGSLDSFKPNFANYDVVVSNYNGYSWPKEINKAFEEYINNGGGLVIIHAANNAFPDWPAYNKMIGVGTGRSPEAGPIVTYDEEQGKSVQINNLTKGSHHTEKYPVKVKVHGKNHPITKGLPAIWMHEDDQIYQELRGPAENMEVLATAQTPIEMNGSGRNEPVMMVIDYGQGRVFQTTLGHDLESQRGVGFITTLQRGTEWAASGKVTQKIPNDFPSEKKGSRRP